MKKLSPELQEEFNAMGLPWDLGNRSVNRECVYAADEVLIGEFRPSPYSRIEYLVKSANAYHGQAQEIADLKATVERLRSVLITTVHDLNTAVNDDRPLCKNSFFLGMAEEIKEALKETE